MKILERFVKAYFRKDSVKNYLDTPVGAHSPFGRLFALISAVTALGNIPSQPLFSTFTSTYSPSLSRNATPIQQATISYST